MRRSRIVLSIAAVLLLSAGVVVGMLSKQLKDGNRPAVAGGHGGRVDRGPGWFSEALELTPDQKRQMDGIWSEVRGQIGKTWDRKRDLDRKRDADLRALLTPAQIVAYDKVWKDYRDTRSAMDKEREQLVHDANDRSKALLTDTQKARWEAMAKDMHDHHGGGPGDGGPPGGRPPLGPPPEGGRSHEGALPSTEPDRKQQATAK